MASRRSDQGWTDTKGCPAGRTLIALLMLAVPWFVPALRAQTPAAPAIMVTLSGAPTLYSETGLMAFMGVSNAPAGSAVTVSVGTVSSSTRVIDGRWSLSWPTQLQTGVYPIRVTVKDLAGQTVSASANLRVQVDGRLPRKPLIAPPAQYGPPPPKPQPEDYKEMTDRWRIVPPPYELNESPKGAALGKDARVRTDPYNQNVLKGDFPIWGQDTFFVFTGISDTLAESRTLPTPSGASARRPESIHFFGRDEQNLLNQNVILTFELLKGLTGYRPVSQRLRATLIGNLSYVRLEEQGLLKPDVRRGIRRTDGRVSLQELFYERKLKDLSPNFDFVSIRFGSQPFVSDFRGFIFSDTNTGIRLFGNYDSNRVQYNLAVFDRLEKDTNSGLNTNNERRGQQVVVANMYRQDFFFPGYTTQFSVHYMNDEKSFKYDRNGILARPAPVGIYTPHRINATYLGWAGLGHIGRYNVDHAYYYVFGRDSLNPIAGRDPGLRENDSVNISASMAALEVSYDRDWLRPRLAVFYSQGDGKPRDRHAQGFDTIFDSPNFAGGGFSFFNRLGIRLTGSGVALVERGSLIPSLRSSKDEGQPQYVNPGLHLYSAGLDIDVTPRLKAIITGNYIQLDTPKSIEQTLFQGDIHKELGTDLSLGLKYRPYLNNNVVLVGGFAGFIPGRGFRDIYESNTTLYHFFTNVILTF